MRKRVGLIVDSLRISKQLSDLLELSKTSENYEIVALIINQGVKSNNQLEQAINFVRRRGFRRFFSKIAFKALCMMEQNLIKRIEKYASFYDTFDLREKDFSTVSVSPKISSNGLVYHYVASDIDKIKALNLELLVRAGSGILKGEILDVCPSGILSFHHADNNINRGGPPGFWEVYEKNPRTGFVIQKLNDELDGGDILYKGFITTSWLYSLNLVKLYEISNPFFHQVIEGITSENSKHSIHEKVPYCYPLYTHPSLFQIIKYVLKTLAILSEKICRRLWSKEYRWGVAYQFSNTWNDVTLWRSQKIDNPKNRFLADPFVIKHNGHHYCFVEDYDYMVRKGSISTYEITPAGYERIGVVLEEDFHLLYPFIFQYENQYFMCPETHEKGEIRLYRCTDFPRKWIYDRTLMKDVSAADTNIFYHEGKWWLFTNIDNSIVGDHNCQLHIFSSDCPLSNNWHAHVDNPVIFDPLRARNGGVIIQNGEVYRTSRGKDLICTVKHAV